MLSNECAACQRTVRGGVVVGGPGSIGEQGLLSLGRFAAALAGDPAGSGLKEGMEVLRHETGANRCELFLVDGQGDELLLVEEVSRRPRHRGPERLQLQDGLEGLSVERGEPLWADITPVGLALEREDLVEADFAAALCVPVCQEGEAVGVLQLVWRRDLWAEARRQIGRFVNCAMPLLAAQVMSTQQRGLVDLLLSCRNGPPDLQDLIHAFKDVSGADIATVHLLAQDGEGVVDRDSTSSHFLTCDGLEAGLLSECPRETGKGRCTGISGPRRKWDRRCRSLGREFQTVLEIPLVEEGTVLGVVFLGWKEGDRVSPLAVATRVSLLARCAARLVSARRLEAVPCAPASAMPVAEERRLEIRVLGGMSVFVDGRLVPPRAFGRSKSLELLALLAMRRGRRASREYLWEALWPDATPESGLSRLHVTVHALRKVIEPQRETRGWHHILEEQGSFWLPMETVSLDLVVFEDLLSSARRKRGTGESLAECLDLADSAIRLCHGELLGDRLEWEWADPCRVAFSDKLRDAFGFAVASAMQLDRPDLAVSYLRVAVQAQPFREDYREELVRILLKDERTSEANRVLGSWREFNKMEEVSMLIDG